MSEHPIEPVTADEADTTTGSGGGEDQADETAADNGEGVDAPEQDAPAGYTEA